MPIAAAALAFVPFTLIQAPLAELARDDMGHLGWVLHDLGDLDGDGRDELGAAYAGRYVDSTCCSVLNVFSLAADRREHHAELQVTRGPAGTGVADACGEALAVLHRGADDFAFAIGAPGAGRDGKNCGAVALFDSLAEPRRPRQVWKGDAGADEFGAALARIPDGDADGRDDLAIGAPGDGRGRVVTASSRTGELLASITPYESCERFGAALAFTLDVRNLGSHRRLAVGAPGGPTSKDRRGVVMLYSFGDEKLVRSITGNFDREHFGARLASNDLDGDGAPELVVGSLGEGDIPARVSVVRNGAAGRVWVHCFASAARLDGTNLSVCGDLDGDGTREVLATFVPENVDRSPEFVVLSGRDGRVVHAIRSVEPRLSDAGAREFRSDALGIQLARHIGAVGAGDQDGDGVCDVWLAVGSGYGGAAERATVSLLSGKDLGAAEKRAPRDFGARTSIDDEVPCASENDSRVLARMGELPLVRKLELGDDLSDDDRGWVCTDSALGKSLASLGDLDGDGLDELWISGIGHTWDDYYSFLYRADESEPRRHWKSGDFTCAVRVGDLDGDGLGDFVLGARDRTFRFCEMIGRAKFVSGRTERERWEVKHPGGAYDFAQALEPIGDIDCDGVNDLAISTPTTSGWRHPDPNLAPRTCEVALVALHADGGTFVRTLYGDASSNDRFGSALAYGGDWDGDGVADLAIGAPNSSWRAPRAGAVHVFSGANWRCLATLASAVPGEDFGRTLRWTRDLDGDGRSELVVAAPLYGVEGHGRVVVLSSRSNAALYQCFGPRPWSGFGASLALADFDGDGQDELVVGAPGSWHAGELVPGSVSILDPRDGRELARIDGELVRLLDFTEGVESTQRIDPPSQNDPFVPAFGRSLAIARDLDGDGAADLVIGEPAYTGPEHAGSVYALSGATLRDLIRHR